MKNLIKMTFALMLVLGVSCSKDDDAVKMAEMGDFTYDKVQMMDMISIDFEAVEGAIGYYVFVDGENVATNENNGIKVPFPVIDGEFTIMINMPEDGAEIKVQALKGEVLNWKAFAEGSFTFDASTLGGDEPALENLRIVDGVNSGSKDITWDAVNGDDFYSFVLLINGEEVQRADDSPNTKEFTILESKLNSGDKVKVVVYDYDKKELASAEITVE
jgi:hypothetical protein